MILKVIAVTPRYDRALADIKLSLDNWHLCGRLGWREIKRRYRRTSIGPFWTSFNLAIMVFAMGFLWAALFGQRVGSYMPYLCAGLVTWQFIGSVIGEGALVFTSNQSLLTSLRVPQTLLVVTMVWRNIIVFFHNLTIFVLVMLIWGTPITRYTLLFIPGLALLVLNGIWVGLFMGMISTRLRDIPQAVSGTVMLVMFLTPVMWSRTTLKGRELIANFIDINPFYHAVEVVRTPLLGQAPAITSWIVVSLTFVVGSMVTFFLFSRFRQRIPYWL